MTGWHGFSRKNAHKLNDGHVPFFFFPSHTCCSLWSRVPPMPCLGTTGVRPATRARRLAAGLGQCSPDRAGCSNRRGPMRAVASAGGDADGARPAGTAAGDTRRRQPARASKSTHAVGVGPAEASDGQRAHPSARARHPAAVAASAPRPRRTGALAPSVLRKRARRVGPDTKPDPGGPMGDGPQLVPRRLRVQPRCCQRLPVGRPLPRQLCLRPESPSGPAGGGLGSRNPRSAGCSGRLRVFAAGQRQATRVAKRMLVA